TGTPSAVWGRTLAARMVGKAGRERPQTTAGGDQTDPSAGLQRSKIHSQCAGSAKYGHCAARKLDYFGYKRVMLTTLAGLPLVYDLVSANTDEREAADGVLQRVGDCDSFGNKGFIGDDWPAAIRQHTGNRLWTAKRANQALQNPPEFDRLLGSVREPIEG